MANKCVVMLEGRLVSDPVLNYSKNGIAYANTRIAYSRKDKNGANGYTSDFYSITAYDVTAEILSQYKKGQLVQVEGKLKKTEYENKIGTKVRDVEITIYRVLGISYPSAPKDGGQALYDEVDVNDDGEEELADE